MNKKRIIITLIIILLLAFIGFNFKTISTMVQGQMHTSFVNDGDMEFTLEKDANLRNKPIYSSNVKGIIAKGTNVKVLQELNKWIQITDGNYAGWVVKSQVVTIEEEPSTAPNEPVQNVVENNVSEPNVPTNEITSKPSENVSTVGKKGVVNVDTARVRETPNGTMVGLVDFNDEVEILAEEGDWYKVNVDEYKNCYIAKRLVTIK